MKLKRTTLLFAGGARRIVAASLAITLGLGAVAPAVSAPAYAATSQELSSQVKEAKERLGELNHQLESAQAAVDSTQLDLEDTRERISELEDDIAQKQEQLKEAQTELAGHVSESYKTGGISLVDILFSSTSLSDLTSQLYYAGRVAQAESDQISTVRELQEELKSQQSELAEREDDLSNLLEDQTKSQQELEQSVAEAKAYTDSLSDELQEALEKERAAAAAEERRKAAEAAAQAQQELEKEQSQQNGSSSSSNSSSAQKDDSDDAPSSSKPSTGTSGGGSSSGSSTSSSSGGMSSSTRQKIVNAAMTQLGVEYIFGAYSPGSALDCSGLTKYAYAQAGITITHSSAAQYRKVVNAGNLTTNMNALQVGDLVFYGNPNISHVAIYIGGGKIIHANGYGRGVMISRVGYSSNFRGGGSPI